MPILCITILMRIIVLNSSQRAIVPNRFFDLAHSTPAPVCQSPNTNKTNKTKMK